MASNTLQKFIGLGVNVTKPKSYKPKPRKPLIENSNAYPVRFKTLGKSRGSMQGVAGWRSNYHRLDEYTRDSGDYLTEYLKSLKH